MIKHFVDEWISREWYIREANTKGDLDVIDEVITRDMYHMRTYASRNPAPALVIDVGAHIGTFSVLSRVLWPNVPIISFEPNPVSFELLEANTRGMDVHCVNAAVSYGYRGELVYVDSIRSTGSGFVIEREKAEEAKAWKQAADGVGYQDAGFTFPTTEIEPHIPDSLFASPGWFLMKLDAELAEVNVLNGMNVWLAGRLSCIVGEYHCERGWKEFMERVDVKRFPQLTFQPKDDTDTPIGLFSAI